MHAGVTCIKETMVLSQPILNPFALEWCQHGSIFPVVTSVNCPVVMLTSWQPHLLKSKGVVLARAGIGCHGWAWWDSHVGQNLCTLWWSHILRKSSSIDMWIQVKHMAYKINTDIPLQPMHSQVIEKGNFGEYVNTVFSTPQKLDQAMSQNMNSSFPVSFPTYWWVPL